MQILSNLTAALTHVEVWLPRAIRVAMVLAGAWVLTLLVHRLLRRLQKHVMSAADQRGDRPAIEMENRAATLVAVLGKLANILIWIVALVMSLTELNFHIEALLAGLGVAGIAVGLGAQTLIKDWLGGVFLLLEDQIRIGDAVTVNGSISGSVEQINLRTTLVRSENGALNVIPNGSITTLSNFTRDYSYYIFQVMLANGADADRAVVILNNAGKELAGETEYHPLILAPVEVTGIDRLSGRGATIKARIKTEPSQQAVVGRELSRRVKARLDAEGIKLPAPP